MIQSLLGDVSDLNLSWLIGILLALVAGNFSAKWILSFMSAHQTAMKQGLLSTLSSLLNWMTFYAVVLLFLLYFSKSDWLFYPLYSRDGVDVSVFLIVIAVMIVSLAHRLITLVTQYVLTPMYTHYQVDEGLGYTVNQMIYYTVMIIALGISFTSVGIDLTALGAVLGVLGIGIGFGMRNIAGNFVSGIIILFERPIEVGELIEIDRKVGRVEKISLRSTVIRTLKEGVLIVPNQYFIEQIIKNRTSADMIAEVTVSVAYGTDTGQVDRLLRQAAKRIKAESKAVLPKPEPDVRFVGVRGQSLEFLVDLPVLNVHQKEQVESLLRHAVIQLFMEHGIPLPPGRIGPD